MTTTIILVLSLVTTLVLVVQNADTRRKLNDSQREVIAVREQSNNLLAANDDLAVGVVKDNKLFYDFLRDHPEDVPKSIVQEIVENNDHLMARAARYVLSTDEEERNEAVRSYLVDNNIAHDWSNVQVLRLAIADEGRYKIRTRRCEYCGLEDRFYVGAMPSHDEVPNVTYDGFFMGGKRLDTMRMPHCFEVQPSTASEDDTTFLRDSPADR